MRKKDKKMIVITVDMNTLIILRSILVKDVGIVLTTMIRRVILLNSKKTIYLY